MLPDANGLLAFSAIGFAIFLSLPSLGSIERKKATRTLNIYPNFVYPSVIVGVAYIFASALILSSYSYGDFWYGSACIFVGAATWLFFFTVIGAMAIDFIREKYYGTCLAP